MPCDIILQLTAFTDIIFMSIPYACIRLVLKCGLAHLNANARDESNANVNAMHLNQIQVQMQMHSS